MSRSESGAQLQVVLATVPDADVGARLARVLIEARLAACVNLVPGVRSLYRWEGRLEEAAEVLMVIKTRAEHVDALSEKICAHHPYDLPEVLSLPVVGGSEPYRAWVRQETAR